MASRLWVWDKCRISNGSLTKEEWAMIHVTIHVTYSINACFLVHVILFNIPHKINCIQIETSPIPAKICKFRPLLRAYEIWLGRDPYRATLWHLLSGVLSKGIPCLAIAPCTANTVYDPFPHNIHISIDRNILLYGTNT